MGGRRARRLWWLSGRSDRMGADHPSMSGATFSARLALLALSLAAAIPAFAQAPPPKCVATVDGCSITAPRELSAVSDNFEVLLGTAKAARERGELAKALADLDRAVTLRPQSALAHYLRGLTLADRGEL